MTVNLLLTEVIGTIDWVPTYVSTKRSFTAFLNMCLERNFFTKGVWRKGSGFEGGELNVFVVVEEGVVEEACVWDR